MTTDPTSVRPNRKPRSGARPDGAATSTTRGREKPAESPPHRGTKNPPEQRLLSGDADDLPTRGPEPQKPPVVIRTLVHPVGGAKKR